MPNRAYDWLRQGQRDLEHARRAAEDGDFEWACFAAQQAAEKVAKAALQHSGLEAWGHSVTALLESLPDAQPPDPSLLDGAREWTNITFQHAIRTRTRKAHPVSITRKLKLTEPSVTPRPSSASVRIFSLNRRQVVERLKTAARELAQQYPEIERIVLFGSLARGEAVPGSDADLLIILRDCDLPFLDRSVRYRPQRVGLGVDVLAYTREELERMEKDGNRLVRQALAEAIDLV